MRTIFHYGLGLLAILMTLGLTVVMLVVFRRERRLNAFTPLLSALVSLVLLALFMLVSAAPLRLVLTLIILLAGGMLGLLWGFTIKIHRTNGQVVSRHSRLFLLGWCLSLALSQALNLSGSALLSSLGLIPLVFSSGAQVGISANLFLRRVLLYPPKATA